MQPFQVYARIRPLNERELQLYDGRIAVAQLDATSLVVGDQQAREAVFQLDQVFGQEVSNTQIFGSAVQPLLDSFLSGINSTVFAYGITGAGKSFTMFGRPGESGQRGIIELSLQYLCGQASMLEGTKLSLSYLEIYNEQVFDLFKQKSQNLQILDDPVLGVTVCDLEEVEVHSVRAAQSLIELGNTRRVVAETKANQFSSRSHAIVQVALERKVGDTVVVGRFSLVDLAGSQRQNVYSEQKGLRNLQGSNINRSLLTLGNCITLLSDRKKAAFVPYRDSKLTRLLKDSLGGNTQTAMIACVSPSSLSYEQTLNTMKYACRARTIEKKVTRNVREPRTNEQLRREIVRLRKDLEFRQDGKCNVSKIEMQDFIQKLIKNVETLTLTRQGQPSDLMGKMRELQLIEQQRTLINLMLARFQEEEKEDRELFRSNTAEPGVSHNRQKKIHKSMSDNEISILRNIQNVSRNKNVEHACKISNIPELSEQYQASMLVPPLQGIKNISFVRGNLQNFRLRYQQEKKNIKQVICEYQANIDSEQDKLKAVERALQLLASENDLLGAQDRKILEKIAREQILEDSDLSHYNISRSEEAIQSNTEPVSHYKTHRTLNKEPSNRFLSSLQQIRKMMRRISGTVSTAQVDDLPTEEDQHPEYDADCIKHLHFQ